jgi:hypothetical protein
LSVHYFLNPYRPEYKCFFAHTSKIKYQIFNLVSFPEFVKHPEAITAILGETLASEIASCSLSRASGLAMTDKKNRTVIARSDSDGAISHYISPGNAEAIICGDATAVLFRVKNRGESWNRRILFENS